MFIHFSFHECLVQSLISADTLTTFSFFCEENSQVSWFGDTEAIPSLFWEFWQCSFCVDPHILKPSCYMCKRIPKQEFFPNEGWGNKSHPHAVLTWFHSEEHYGFCLQITGFKTLESRDPKILQVLFSLSQQILLFSQVGTHLMQLQLPRSQWEISYDWPMEKLWVKCLITVNRRYAFVSE